MAKNITLMDADYPDVPAVQLPQTGGGTATFYDIQVVDNLNSDSSTDALSAKQGKVLNGKIVEFHKITVTGTTTASGAINSGLNANVWEIISVRCTSQVALAFHRGDAYIMVKKADDLSAVANTNVTIDIVYAWKDSIPN